MWPGHTTPKAPQLLNLVQICSIAFLFQNVAVLHSILFSSHSPLTPQSSSFVWCILLPQILTELQQLLFPKSGLGSYRTYLLSRLHIFVVPPNSNRTPLWQLLLQLIRNQVVLCFQMLGSLNCPLKISQVMSLKIELQTFERNPTNCSKMPSLQIKQRLFSSFYTASFAPLVTTSATSDFVNSFNLSLLSSYLYAMHCA